MKLENFKKLYPDTWVIYEERYPRDPMVHSVINSIETEILQKENK